MKYIIIHDLSKSKNKSYKAFSEKDCKDAIDLIAYKLCIEHGDCITMGMVIAEPVR